MGLKKFKEMLRDIAEEWDWNYKLGEKGEPALVEVAFQDGRSQVVAVAYNSNRECVRVFSKVGEINDDVDPMELLEINASTTVSKVAVIDGDILVVCEMYEDIVDSDVFGRILKEVSSIADTLEEKFFGVDEM